MSDLENLTRDYRTAFLRYLPHRSEAAVTIGYELGRRTVAGGASLLDLIQIHHAVLGEILADPAPTDPRDVTAAACDFLLEVLSSFEMIHRALLANPPHPDHQP